MKVLESCTSNIRIQQFFNLGLHMGNKKKSPPVPRKKYKRGRWALYNPLHLFREFNAITRLLTGILQAGGQIAIINNGPLYGKVMSGRYQSLFEGTNVICFEDEWLPGTFTNPLFGYNLPDAIVYLTASDKDHAVIFSEISNLKIPLFNLSSEKYFNNLLPYEVMSIPSRAFFFIHLLYYWIREVEAKKMNGVIVAEKKKKIRYYSNQQF